MPHTTAAGRGALAGFALHTLSVLVLWLEWEPGVRRALLVWLDFPVALSYLALGPRTMLATSLAVGGLQWAAIGGALAALVGRASRRTAP